MTAIVPHVQRKPPAIAWSGLVLPGLGHVLLGEVVIGIGLLALDGLWFWTTIAGLPRVKGLFIEANSKTDFIHITLALLTWATMGIALWTIAYLRANPRQQCEEEYNSNWQIFLRLFRRHQAGMIGLYGVLLLILLTLLTPLLAPFDPIDIDTGPTSIGPCWNNLMGTDEYGRDVFSRVLFGGRISLSIGFIAVSIAASIGTSIGAIAGYLGGWVDRFLMFLVDMLLSLPRLVLLLAIVGVFRVQGVWGLFLIIFILGLTGWMGVSRIIRSQVLSLKQQDFIQAARALGMSSTRIIFRHLIPNAMAPVIVYCSLAIGTTIIAEAGLSFLGLGVPPPTSTWGTMVNDGRDPLRLAPWIALFPGLMIVGAVMSFNLLGDGLRDALDPKLRGH
jgi:peptide/nickel transport system permease protein